MRRWLSSVAVVTMGLAVAAPAIAAPGVSATTPAHSVVLTHGASPFQPYVILQAASPTRAVYTTLPLVATGATDGGTAFVIGANGVSHRLSPQPSIDPVELAWSMVGSTLTAWGYGDKRVYWWNLSSGSHGVGHLPSVDDYWAGSAPGGWLYYTGANPGELLQQAASGGSPVDRGAPFPTADLPGFSANSDANGTVLTDANGDAAAYLPWGSSTYTPLDLDTTKFQYLFCYGVDGGFAGCTAQSVDSAPTPHNYVVRLPITGAAPVVTTLSEAVSPYAVSVTPSVTAWIDGNTSRLGSVPAGSGTPVTKSSYRNLGNLVAGLGSLLVSTGSQGHYFLGQTTDAGHALKHLSTPARMAVRAGTIALSSNHVAYTTDQKHFATGDVWSRSLSGTSTLSVGKPSLVLPTAATSYGLSLAGSTVAAETGTHQKARVGTHLVSRTGRQGAVSGQWLAYADATTHSVHVFNLKTHKVVATVKNAPVFAFASGDLLFMKGDGSVWRRGITAHRKPVRLSKPVAKKFRSPFGPPGAIVRADGNVVAWSFQTDRLHTWFRNFVSLTKAHTIAAKYALDSIGSDGILVHTTKPSASGTHRATWWLRKPGSTTYHAVLTQTYGLFLYYTSTDLATGFPLFQQVAVTGGRIAWITTGGVARVAPLPKKLR